VVGILGWGGAGGAPTTGAGPHAGGKGAKRIPIGLEDMTRIHAEIVLTSVAVLLALLWVLWRDSAPARVQRSSHLLLAVMVVQGLIGYTQFFSHLPAWLVGIHVFGAAMVWSTVLWFHHGLSDHQPEAVDAAGSGTGPGGSAESDAEPASGPGSRPPVEATDRPLQAPV
jgi:cytochrome c oxidase assembly protein subunit 15